MRYPYKTLKQRHTLQWLYASITITVLLLGWKYPFLGYVVVLAMLGAMISGLIAGRWFCGNLCPRGGFLERILSKISPNKPAPRWLHLSATRIFMLIFLFAMIGLNASQNPTSWEHWGFVFWLICLVTTIFGLILAYFFHARGWCVICPMGTIQSWMGGKKYQLNFIQDKCKQCRLCEKKCPMKLSIFHEVTSTQIIIKENLDCIRCNECALSCPMDILKLEKIKESDKIIQ